MSLGLAEILYTQTPWNATAWAHYTAHIFVDICREIKQHFPSQFCINFSSFNTLCASVLPDFWSYHHLSFHHQLHTTRTCGCCFSVFQVPPGTFTAFHFRISRENRDFLKWNDLETSGCLQLWCNLLCLFPGSLCLQTNWTTTILGFTPYRQTLVQLNLHVFWTALPLIQFEL